MYLTDYRERCLKDVITQLEPGLFKKVTGLSVEDFNMLCSLGVFNAPLMNDAIFKFKRYEDASLTYTGLNKHANDEVGGWDTTIRKTEYEKLFYNQQASMKDVDYSTYSNRSENVLTKHSEPKRADDNAEKSKMHKTKTEVKQAVQKNSHNVSESKSENTQDIELILKTVAVNTSVFHRKFGRGTVVKINNNEKYIFIKFALGEKKFIFPDAFLQGFLELD
jgi:hypothetical protein